MTIELFIEENLEEIDNYIRSSLGSYVDLDNEERELWILNDIALYSWAVMEGVNI